MVADGDFDNIKDFRAGEDLIDLSAWGVATFDQLDLRLGNNDKIQICFQNEKLTVKVLDDQAVTVETIGFDDFIFA